MVEAYRDFPELIFLVNLLGTRLYGKELCTFT